MFNGPVSWRAATLLKIGNRDLLEIEAEGLRHRGAKGLIDATSCRFGERPAVSLTAQESIL